MNTSSKREIETTDGAPSAKRTKFGNPNNQERGGFSSRGSFRGRSNFNRGRGGFNRGRGGFGGGPFNRGRGGSFNRGRGGWFENSNNYRDSSGAKNIGNFEQINGLKICFPDSQESNIKQALSEVLEKCDQISSPRCLETYWNPQTLIEKLPLLKEIKIDNKPISFSVTTQSESKTKKNVFIPRRFQSNKENVVKFFNATSISEYSVADSLKQTYILTFKSSQDASKAAKKVMVTDSTIICLKPHYEEVLLANTDGKENVRKLEEKLKSLAKETKTKQIEEDSIEVDEDGSDDEEDDDEQEEEESDDDEEEEGDAGEDEGDTDEEEEDVKGKRSQNTEELTNLQVKSFFKLAKQPKISTIEDDNIEVDEENSEDEEDDDEQEEKESNDEEEEEEGETNEEEEDDDDDDDDE